MTREQFEQLVSEWLAEPSRLDLRARVDAAARLDPEFARLRDEHQRLATLLKQHTPQVRGVAWDKLHARLTAAVHASATEDDRLDDLLARLPQAEAQVDWQRYSQRVTHAVHRSDPAVVRGRRLRWLGAATGVGLAAAAVLLAIRPHVPTPSSSTPRSVAPEAPVAFRIDPLPASAADAGVATVHVVRKASQPVPERFFSLDPLPQPVRQEAAPDFF